MSKLLLTAFEAFGSDSINASLEVLPRLTAVASELFDVYPHVLPVDAAHAPQQIRALLRSLKPDWCVMLVQANGRAALSVERVALNLCDFRIPDNDGQQLTDQPVIAGGPAAYFATLPVKQLVAAAQDVGVPAEQSLGAGAYLCNLVSYVALHLGATERLKTRCGFVHVPLLPEQTDVQAVPTMGLAVMQRGLAAMLAALADTARADTLSFAEGAAAHV